MPRITLLLIVIAVTMCAERRHALERPGLHHATIEGRVVDQRGVPIAGTLVQLAQSSVRSLPMSEAVAGSDGSFRFVDVSAQTGVELRLFPPSGWSGGTVSVPSASGRMVLLGDLRLEQALTIYLLIEETGKETAQGARPEVSAAFDAGPVRRRVASRQAQGMLVLDGVPKVKGRLEVTRRQGREWEMYRSDLDLSTEGGDFISVQLQRDSMAKTEYGRLEGRMTVTRVSGPPQPLSAAIFSEGRLLWPDGSPAAGVIVSRHDPSSGESGSFGRTAEDGRFRLRADSPCARPGVRHLHNIYPWPTPDSTTACAPAEATISAATRLSLQTTGMPSVLTAAASWWSEDRGWQPIRSLEGWTVYANYPAQVTVKMEAPGYVPVVRPISYVRVDERKGENYPDRVTQIFPFDGQSTRTVEVSGDGRPLSSATVDIESIQELNRNRRLPLGTYRTDARGRLTLLGEANALIEAFVYAEGFEPQRVIWRGGRPVSLDLRRKSAVLVVAGLRRGETVRSAPAEVVAVDNEVSSDGGDEIRLPMAPGDHEVTILDDRGRVKLTQRVKLSAGESVTLHPDRDDRPRVRVLFNGQTGWSASVSRRAVTGEAAGFAIYSTSGGQFTRPETVVVQESRDERQAVFRVTRPGSYEVTCFKRGRPSLSKRVTLGPAQTIELVLPEGEAELEGSMKTYLAEPDSHHGLAGPRFVMVGAGNDIWDVTLHTPPRKEDGAFVITGLPPGRYRLYHHLIGEQKTSEYEGKKHEFNSPLDAWGGIEVELNNGERTKLRDFSEYPYSKLTVRVLDADGNAVTHGVVRVRDRMSEAWIPIGEGPTTLGSAADPIPYPPAEPLRDGTVAIESIRAGWLEFAVELDDGRVYPFTRAIDESRALEVRLP